MSDMKRMIVKRFQMSIEMYRTVKADLELRSKNIQSHKVSPIGDNDNSEPQYNHTWIVKKMAMNIGYIRMEVNAD